MMKKVLFAAILAILSLSSGQALAQDGVAPAKAKASIDTVAYQRHLNVYYNALRYNDYPVARMSLYQMMAINPNSLSLADTLAYLYVEQNQFSSSLILSNDILSVAPDDQFALEVSGFSYEQLGFRKEALDRYETLHLKTSRVDILYKIAFLQFQLGRLAEAKVSANELITNEEASGLTVQFPTSQGQQVIEVPMPASLHNLLGLIAKQQGDKKTAMAEFEKALELHPDFAVAQKNLAEVQN